MDRRLWIDTLQKRELFLPKINSEWQNLGGSAVAIVKHGTLSGHIEDNLKVVFQAGLESPSAQMELPLLTTAANQE